MLHMQIGINEADQYFWSNRGFADRLEYIAVYAIFYGIQDQVAQQLLLTSMANIESYGMLRVVQLNPFSFMVLHFVFSL